MQDDGQGGDNVGYIGAETTGFQSPAQDHIEHVIDLATARMFPTRDPIKSAKLIGVMDGSMAVSAGGWSGRHRAAMDVEGGASVAAIHNAARRDG